MIASICNRVILRVFNRVNSSTALIARRALSHEQSKAPSESQHELKPNSHQKQIQIRDAFAEKPYSAMSPGEKVVEGSKDSFYMLVIIGGIALTGFVGYVIFRELFSRETPNGIYSDALKICRENSELQRIIGTPMLGFGEETRRGRRWLIAHEEFLLEGVKCMRMQFHVKGPNTQGLVNLEVRKDSSDRYQYRYLFVEVPSSRKPIVLIDNRSKQ